jgi:hypothetical protein
VREGGRKEMTFGKRRESLFKINDYVEKMETALSSRERERD